MALRVISRRRSNSVAFGAKRAFSGPRLQSRIYEYTPWMNDCILEASEPETEIQTETLPI